MQIKQFPVKTNRSNADLLLVQDATDNQFKHITVSNFLKDLATSNQNGGAVVNNWQVINTNSDISIGDKIFVHSPNDVVLTLPSVRGEIELKRKDAINKVGFIGLTKINDINLVGGEEVLLAASKYSTKLIYIDATVGWLSIPSEDVIIKRPLALPTTNLIQKFCAFDINVSDNSKVLGLMNAQKQRIDRANEGVKKAELENQRVRDRVYGLEKQQPAIRDSVADAKKKANDALYEVRTGRTKLEAEIAEAKKKSNDALYETRTGRTKLEDKIAQVQSQISKFTQSTTGNFQAQITVAIGTIQNRLSTTENKVANIEKAKPTLQDKVIETVQASVKQVSSTVATTVARVTELEKVPIKLKALEETVNGQPAKWGVTVTHATVTQAKVTSSLIENAVREVEVRHAKVTQSWFTATEWVGRYGVKTANLVDNGVNSLQQRDEVLAGGITALATNTNQRFQNLENRNAIVLSPDDKDTAIQTLIRLYYFHEVLGYSKSQLGIFYGMPSEQFQEAVQGKPQVFLYFSQDEASVPDGQKRVEAEYSFRLMDETSATITALKAVALARKIKEEFVTNNSGIVFTKGKVIYKYYDELNGYRLRLYGNIESDAEDLIRRILTVKGHVYDEKRLVVCTPKKASNSNPTTKKTVYGKKITEQRYRPTANVRFRYSYLYIHGISKPIFLVDTTGKHFEALA